jgi:2TM domain
MLMEVVEMTDLRDAPESERDLARKQIQKRRNLQGGLVAYIVFNAFLVGVWAMTGGGYFWPGWVLAGWGVAMILGVWDYYRGPITEADVDEELRRGR